MQMEAHQPLLVKGQEEHEEVEEEEVTPLGRRILRRTYYEIGSGDDQLGSSPTTIDSSKSGIYFREGGHDIEKGDRTLAYENMELLEEQEEQQQQQQQQSGNDTVGSVRVYFDKDQDCIYQHSEELRCSVVEPSNFDPNPGDADILTNNSDNLLKEIDNHKGKFLENKGISSSNRALLEQSPPGHEVKEDDFIEEIDGEETEFDVEKVLEEQNTHDLYCPNCHSCITRRVILRKRKRKVRYIRRSGTNPAPASGEHDQDNAADVFGCLSCFCLFIRTGNCLKRIESSDDIPGNVDPQLPPATSASTSCTSLLSFLFKPKTEEGLPKKIVPGGSRVDTPVSSVGEDPANAAVADDGTRGVVDQTLASQADSPGKHSSPSSTVNDDQERKEPAPGAVEEPAPKPNDGQVVLDIRLPEPAASQRDDGVRIDILKSIVYGGLIESITSLGVVSSAAGAGAATLNILALGLANLIGGLFVIWHNLADLKNEASRRTTDQQVDRYQELLGRRTTDQQVDRYQELLGRRTNFPLHATIAILSYLIFGLLPPIIYGFSFQKSDNVDYKLVAVGCVSLICIALLAIGKAYVQRQPRQYIKTVMSYVVSGIMASGVSFVAGDLIDKLLEKLGWTKLSLAVALESKQLERSWSSY